MIIVGLVVVFHVTALTTTQKTLLAILQEESTSTVPNLAVPNVGGDGGSSDSQRAADLEEEEEEIDEQIKEEVLRRKNKTSVTLKSKVAKGVMSMTPKVAKKVASLDGSQCNNAELVDLSLPGSLALCTCGVNEILVNGSCTYYQPGTVIDVEKYIFHMVETPVSSFRVRVQDVECNNRDTHQSLTFDKGMFYLRNRGDVVLTNNAGHLSGLRISDYCVNHFLDQQGMLTWKMMACLPHPSIPKCCPPNQVFRNGTCHTGPSPAYFMPPIQANPSTDVSIKWPLVRNHVNTLDCGKETLRTVELNMGGSFLLSLPNGLAYRWHPSDLNKRPRYMFCPNLCIDGRQDVDGNIEYLANFCYTSPDERPIETCKTKSCIQKCCKKGEIMSIDHYRCIKANEPFNPPVSGNKSEYEIIVGRPDCSIHLSELGAMVIDIEGNLRHKDYTLPTKDYCMDTFAKQGIKNTQALICPSGSSLSGWWTVRLIVFPVCNVISLFFLAVTVGFYLLAPGLMKQGGWHQLAYVLSLMIAYATTFSINVYRPSGSGCVATVIFMQFGFLSTFFWLSVMCFDVEGKIRSLKCFRAYVPFHTAAYVTFGFGGPLLISLVTLIIETAVPYGSPGIIKPSLGISSCWFHGDIEILLYFYGPISVLFVFDIVLIASTAWHYRKIEKGALGIMMKSSSSSSETNENSKPLEYDQQKQTKKNFADFKHMFLLLSLMIFCWITEVLSWKIPPSEIWALTDILNSLQGFFIFVIFLSNRRNRKTLKKRHPRLFSVFEPIKNFFRKLRGLFLRKQKASSSTEDAVGRSREPSVSSEISDLSENIIKPPEPNAS